MDSLPLLFDLPPVPARPRARNHANRVQAQILAFLNNPRSAEAIALHIGRRVSTATIHLQEMRDAGTAVRLADGSYGTPRLLEDKVAEVHQRAAIQARILAFLTVPRSAKAIAVHIERSVPNATGHLRAMLRKRIVVRLAWGTYGRADLCKDAPDPSTIGRPARLER